MIVHTLIANGLVQEHAEKKEYIAVVEWFREKLFNLLLKCLTSKQRLD